MIRSNALWSVFVVGLTACGSDRASTTPPLVAPPPGSNPSCGDMCGNDQPDAGQVPLPPARMLGDPMEFVSLGQDRFGGFFEPVEIQVVGDRVALCTGVQGLVFYRAEDPCCVSQEASISFSAGSNRFPRCQHFAIDGGRAYVSNRGDEIQPTPFITVLDIQNLDRPMTLSTEIADDIAAFEGVAVRNGVLYAAAHEVGLVTYRIEGDGRLTQVHVHSDELVNAWKPHIDPGGAYLYLADAQGGLKVFALADPLRPQLISQVSTEGIVKDLAQVGNVIYAASGVAGVEVIDVSDPGNPVSVRRVDTPGSAVGIDANSEHLVVADWNTTQLYRLTDTLNPTYVGHQKAYRGAKPDYAGRILDIALRDNDVFMAEWSTMQAHRISPDTEAADLFVRGTVEFPRTPSGQLAEVAVALQNVGPKPLQISAITVTAPFSTRSGPMEIAANSRGVVTLTFEPQDDSSVRGKMQIASNDPDEPLIEIDVQANLPGLRVGDQVPNLRFNDLRGFTVDLESQRGAPVLLAYFATF